MLTSKAKSKYIRVSPGKLRPIVDVIRGYSVTSAMAWLQTAAIKRVIPVKKTLISAFSNAKNLHSDKVTMENMFIKETATMMKTFEVSAEKQEAKTQVKMSVAKVTPKEIKSIPAVGGDPDLAQYLQVLPGVTFTGDQGGQLYIRGGSPVQNKVLLDGMIIYNPFHSIGLFSVFDTDIMRSADVYTGGFNAEYGGRISSIMDIFVAISFIAETASLTASPLFWASLAAFKAIFSVCCELSAFC